jgi:hypothetical protein
MIKQRVKAMAIVKKFMSSFLIFAVKPPFDKLMPSSQVLQETTSDPKNSRHNAAEHTTNYFQLFVPPLYTNLF